MQIELPQFERSFCRSFTVCAHFEVADKSHSELLEKLSGIVVKYQLTNGQAAYLEVFAAIGTEGLGNHLHIDVGTEEFFEEMSMQPPSPTASKEAFDSLMSALDGVNVSTLTTARLSADASLASGILMGMLAPRVVDNEGRKATIFPLGYHLDLPEQMLRELTYKIQETTLYAEFDVVLDRQVTKTYLVEVQTEIDRAFENLFDIKKESQDGVEGTKGPVQQKD